MRREWHIWEKILAIENCREAVRREALTKRSKRSGFSEVLRDDLDGWARYVRERLGDGLQLGDFLEFDTVEHGKLRHVRCYEPKDAMCVRAAVLQMEPCVYRRMTPRSYCPVPGRGGLRLAKDLRRAIAKTENLCRAWNAHHPNAQTKWRAWIETFDEQKFYDSLTFNVMWDPLERIFGDPEVLNLCQVFLGQRDTLPIGAGYSAMVANAVLSPLDWEIVGVDGVTGYARHLDNAAVVAKSKKVLAEVRAVVEDWNAQHGLTAHEWAKFPSDHHAIEAGGWRIDSTRIIPGEKVTKHIRRLLAWGVDGLTTREKLTLASLYGYVKHGESRALQEMWDAARASRVFRAVGTTAKEAASGVVEAVNTNKEAT